MSQQTSTAGALATGCDRTTATTRSLLGYGVIAGPVYVVVSLVQALTRDGFDLSRHAWSLLSNGGLGWIQITNFVLSGLMTVAFAVGLSRALGGGRGAVWGPRLIGAYGMSLVAAGAFRADPAVGFPVGAPTGPVEMSWHGALHFVAGAVGFSCLIAAGFVLAARFAAERRRFWAGYSRLTGVLFLAGFVGVSSGKGGAVTILGFVAAVIIAWAWISVLAVHQYRRLPATGS